MRVLGRNWGRCPLTRLSQGKDAYPRGFFGKMKGAVALVLLAGVAEGGPLEEAAIETCRTEQGNALVCIGAGVEACLSGASDEVRSLTSCLAAETEVWEAWTRQTLLGFEQRFEGRASQMDQIMEVHAAMQVYRNVTCDAAADVWPSMMGSGDAWLACHLQVTAQHALRLEDWLEALQ